MLVSAIRVGATSQNLSKGYQVVASDGLVEPPDDKMTAFERDFRSKVKQTRLDVDPERPSLIWFNTGFKWMGARDERDKVFAALRTDIALAATILSQYGLRLLPNGLCARPSKGQRSHLCGDFHSIQTNTDAEKEIFCNLIREHSATLIAISGKSVFSDFGQGRVASARLQSSNRHYAARYFASVSERHIGKVAKELRRHDGISRLDLLDVAPFAEGEEGGAPIVRLIDGQATLEYARAHAILLQAIMLRARRMAREGRRVGNIPQRIISGNRSKAIMRGVRAGISKEKPKTKGKDQRERFNQNTLEAFVDLLDDLTYELKTLDVAIEELGGLAQGIQLRSKGCAAIRTENDFFAYLSKVAISDTNAPTKEFSALFDNFYLADHPIYETNVRSFPSENSELAELWDRALNSTVRVYRDKKNFKHNKNDKSGNRVRRHSPAKEERDHRQKLSVKLSDFKDAEAQTGQTSLTSLVRNLCRRNSFDFSRSLHGCDRDEVRQIKKLVRQNCKSYEKYSAGAVDWGSGVLSQVVSQLREEEYSLISFDLPEKEYSTLGLNPKQITRERPTGFGAAVFHSAKYKAGKNGGMRQVFELLVWRDD